MYESLLHGQSPNDNLHSGYLKIEEGKNNWVEYWVTIRDNRIFLYSDQCSEESGEEALKTIHLSDETRCELLQRRNYHFRFKLVLGTNTLFKLKCRSAFHRKQWISKIMLASSKDRVIALNGSQQPRELNHRRTQSTDSQLSSGTESEFELNGAFSDCGTSLGRRDTSEPETPTKSPERKESRGLFRRLSLKAPTRLRQNKSSSPCREQSEPSTPVSTLSSPDLKENESSIRDIPINESPVSLPKGGVDLTKVFVNAAFVPSPSASPAVARRTEPGHIDLIDIA